MCGVCVLCEKWVLHILDWVLLLRLTRFVIKPIVCAGNLDRVIVVVVLF